MMSKIKFLELEAIEQEGENKQIINISHIVRIEAVEKNNYPKSVSRIYFSDGSSFISSRDYETLRDDLLNEIK